ncbi:MAG TPA: fumarylacetoacetate hydrolase family protein [Pseudolabrys sp.]|jgi:2-keto-4-pentenoate hydratase/2-oxohepta-3-ene-1,7-dioic acid hydratase in catechol pathway|nr:fumarylacetoacetate hydrolase family protein [Pseudolabrys sp.]
MKLVRYRSATGEKPGLVLDGEVFDLSGSITALTPRAPTFDDIEAIAAVPVKALSKVNKGAVLGPPLRGIGKIIGVGLNYRDHAEETGLPLPKEPTLFLKATSALCGPTDDLVMPREAKSVDWEVELGVVIGKAGAYIAAHNALDHVLGYCIGIDFSERDFQFNRGGQGFKGKSADTFAPLGPFLATSDEIADPQDLSLRLSVNGKLKQNGSTCDMIFSVAELVSYISRFMSLQPGDVILTGTPAGVGLGHKPPVYLQAGDVVTASIDGLGEQTHKVVASG